MQSLWYVWPHSSCAISSFFSNSHIQIAHSGSASICFNIFNIFELTLLAWPLNPSGNDIDAPRVRPVAPPEGIGIGWSSSSPPNSIDISIDADSFDWCNGCRGAPFINGLLLFAGIERPFCGWYEKRRSLTALTDAVYV